MKCIHCDSDTNYRDRTANGGRCAACHHAFAFEPKTDPNRVADGFFQRCIKDVSADDTLYFTEHQLYYEFNRRLLARKTFGCGAASIAFLMLGAGGAAAASAIARQYHPHLPPLPEISPAFWTAALGGAAAVAVTGGTSPPNRKKPKKARYPKVSYNTFLSSYLERWHTVHGTIPKLLAPIVASSSREGGGVSPDVTAYSFDRALITERANTAAMLVANRFHFENNCAILSFDRRFPGGNRVPAILEMLRRNPNLSVFALHDASAQGMTLASRLREEAWFPNAASARIFDLGLRPRHAMDGRMLLAERSESQISVPAPVEALLTPEEAQWLRDGNSAEVAALRPARLMRSVFNGFAQANQFLSSSDSSFSGDSGSTSASDQLGIIYLHDAAYSSGFGPEDTMSSSTDSYMSDSFG